MDLNTFLHAKRDLDHSAMVKTLESGKALPSETVDQLRTLENLSRYDLESRITNTGLMAKFIRMAVRNGDDDMTEEVTSSDMENFGYWLENEMQQVETMLGENSYAVRYLRENELNRAREVKHDV
ncbi:hypothetical protein J3998_12050 [Thiomicrorhabdus sp. 6S2-11]|uniref:Uncharacterized protein n=1 Tax=Thiomicrorhabdus marina TaxID=2818442 RepID=A0ABS3Q7L6_9GAMM|nr:hypothetical protein [Thiomicrorhabdus marina]MBO1928306.1 hypothetical protein [Thiomicrorhabdus marina]